MTLPTASKQPRPNIVKYSDRKRFVLYGVLLNALEKINYMDSGLA